MGLEQPPGGSPRHASEPIRPASPRFLHLRGREEGGAPRPSLPVGWLRNPAPQLNWSAEVENQPKGLKNTKEFESYFEREASSLLTDDYFRITLPENLDSNEAIGPYWQGFVASQIILGAKGLFSTAPLSQLIALGSSGTKNAVDKHHIFPDNYLKRNGQLTRRSNKGNFTLVDYPNNIYISDDDPAVYVKKYRDSLGETEYERNCQEHALPLEFETMDYEEFLKERRKLMSQLVKTAFSKL